MVLAQEYVSPLFQYANYAEAGLWGCIAAVAMFRMPRRTSQERVRAWALIFALITFGISDIIEAQTGAWWRPMGLLVLKGMCLATFLAVAIHYFRGRTKA